MTPKSIMLLRTSSFSFTTGVVSLRTALAHLGELPRMVSEVTITNESGAETLVIKATGKTSAPTGDYGVHLDAKGGKKDNYYFTELDIDRTWVAGSGTGTADIEFDLDTTGQ